MEEGEEEEEEEEEEGKKAIIIASSVALGDGKINSSRRLQKFESTRENELQ